MRSLPGAWVMSSHRTMTWPAGILKKDARGGDGVPRQIHIGEGLEQADLAAAHFPLAPQPLELGLGDRDLPLAGQVVQSGKPGVVAGALVFGLGIAQAGDQPDVVCCHKAFPFVCRSFGQTKREPGCAPRSRRSPFAMRWMGVQSCRACSSASCWASSRCFFWI